jgi:CRISPR/Cas system-associated exonuclease Cas4 (RecB family)
MVLDKPIYFMVNIVSVNKITVIKKFEYTPILGWSTSRYDMFLLCRRQYYYNYYGKHDPLYSRQKIDELKKLTSIPLEIGNVTHDVIKVFLDRLLKSEGKIDTGRFFDYARRKTEEYCHAKRFMEVYYDEISSIDIDELFAKIQNSLSNFLNSDRCNWLTTKVISNKQSWLIEPSGYGETRIDEMKAYCKVDFLFPCDDNIYIIDWKTGKRDEKKHKKQLLGYVSWAAYHFEKDPIKIIPIIAYLQPSYEEMKMNFNEYDIQDFAIHIKEETEEMYSVCSNIEENIPEDKERFTKTTNTKICNYCNYRELCR